MLALANNACASMLRLLLEAQTIANLSRGILRLPRSRWHLVHYDLWLAAAGKPR